MGFTVSLSSPEQDRLDQQGIALVELMHGKVFHAPIPDDVKLALEAGCGTGVVTCYLGRRFPSAHIYGVDLSPGNTLQVSENCLCCAQPQQIDVHIVPPIHQKPPNVTYVQGDISVLVKDPSNAFRPGSFDLYFHRMLVAGLTDWQSYVHNAASLIRSGGYMELQDMSFVFHRDNPSQNGAEIDFAWHDAFKAAGLEAGMDWDGGSNIKRYMENSGLTNIKMIEFRMPIGLWLVESQPETKAFSEYGSWAMPLVVGILGKKVLSGAYSQEEMKKWEADMQRATAMMIEEGGWYIPFSIAVGRKP